MYLRRIRIGRKEGRIKSIIAGFDTTSFESVDQDDIFNGPIADDEIEAHSSGPNRLEVQPLDETDKSDQSDDRCLTIVCKYNYMNPRECADIKTTLSVNFKFGVIHLCFT